VRRAADARAARPLATRPEVEEILVVARSARRRTPCARGVGGKDMILETVDRFHELYYDSPDRTWRNTWWMGVPTYKCPLDLWIYQEILWELKPDLVIECGTAEGGSALYIAHILDLIGKGDVITVDLNPAAHPPSHPRIHYLHGSSTDPAIVRHLEDAARGKGAVIVILDSNHTREHVAEELRLYQRLVTPDSYLIVEDTNINGHPVVRDHGPGPGEAVQEFLSGYDAFSADVSREKFFLSFNPGGYLRRRRL
jgi:cephalosporin hydroxylase